MYRHLQIAVVIPCYNEQLLIEKTVESLPDIIDNVIAVNDASTDTTFKKLNQLAKYRGNLVVLNNEQNGGVGFSLKRGFQYAIEHTKSDVVGIVSGDAQCDPAYIQPMLDQLIDRNCDYVKGNRFLQRHTIKSMPAYRRIGNIFISLLTKFSTGYYSISDTAMGFGVLRTSILRQLDFTLIKNRYDYETSMLVALSIAGARLKDIAVPAIYGEETSNIDFWPTVFRVLRVVWVGFWQRIYYKYILFSLHPVVIFLFGGLLVSMFGWLYGLYLLIEKLFNNATPTSGTVMLAVLPIILGFQLLLTALTIDINNEDRP